MADGFETFTNSDSSEAFHLANVEAPPAVAKSGQQQQKKCQWLLTAGNIVFLSVMMTALVVGIVFVAHHCSRPKVYIVLTVNRTAIAACPQGAWTTQHPLPCMTDDDLMMTSDGPLAPLVCDAAEANCEADMFQLTPARDGVIIREAGVYKVHSRVTFLESDPGAYVTSTVRVDKGGSAGADGDPGIWLDCASHSAHLEASNPFSDCTLDGVKWLRPGDIVSFQVRSLLRQVNLHSRATHFHVYRL